MSRPSSNPQTSGTRPSSATASAEQQANVPQDSTPLHIIKKIYGTPRRPVFSLRRITPKDADYERQMLLEIDTEFRTMSYDDFMKDYVPRSALSLDAGKMKKASHILAKGLNVAFVRDRIQEAYMYPILVSVTRTQLEWDTR
jgi:hypothetical protein